MQIVSEVLGISMDRIDCLAADTDGLTGTLGIIPAGACSQQEAQPRRQLRPKRNCRLSSCLLETEPDDIELHRQGLRKNEEKTLPSRRDGPLPVREHEELMVAETYEAKRGATTGHISPGGSKHPDR